MKTKYKFKPGDEVLINLEKLTTHNCSECDLLCTNCMLSAQYGLAIVTSSKQRSGNASVNVYTLRKKDGEPYPKEALNHVVFCEHMLLPANNVIARLRKVDEESKI